MTRKSFKSPIVKRDALFDLKNQLKRLKFLKKTLSEQDQLDDLIVKWNSACRESLEYLATLVDNPMSLDDLSNQLGFDINEIGNYDEDDDCFLDV
jgi:hypothetical protein